MASINYLTCLCGAVTEPGSLLSSHEVPIECVMCHCDTCRQSTGSLAVSYFQLKGSPSKKSLENASVYHTPKYERYFCKGCGCNVFGYCKTDGRWLASTGTLETQVKPGESRNISKIKFHEYVGDTSDGGIAPQLARVAKTDIPCWLTEPGVDDQPLTRSELLKLQEKASKTPTTARGKMMKVACHCGGVKLHIAQPAYDEQSEDWYVPGNRSKYLARVCCCRSCRLSLGFTMHPFTYVPPSQIFTDGMEPVVFGPKAKEGAQIPGLKYYQSSPSVLWSFCTTCGASIFYQNFDRPYIINPSVGVIRSTVGNGLAGEWLEWDRKVMSFREDAVDEELVRAWLEEGKDQ